MNKFTKIVLAMIGALFALIIIAGFTGCDNTPQRSEDATSTSPATPPTSPAPADSVTYSYDLPKGFEWFDTPQDLVIINHKGSKDGANGFVKMEPEFRIGTAADAKADIKRRFDDAVQACNATATETADFADVKCTWKPEYKELKIAGTTVYMAIDKSYAESADPYWYTNFAFEVPANPGYIMSAIFYDRADLYRDMLTTIINSLQITKIKQ